jgi:hypothetical protein
MRGAALGVLMATLAGGVPALAQPAPQATPPQATPPQASFWFDPTQLPTFTGTVERYLVNPAGETDALLFREGPQVVFPPDIAAAVRDAAAPGRTLVVWGIRARQAPVITMLAFAAAPDATLGVVDRFYWRLGGAVRPEAPRISASGVVRSPYFAPQGQLAGAVLEDGTVVILPSGGAEAFAALLRPGARLAAEGQGHEGEGGRALVADRLGEQPDALRPVPPPATPGRR